MEGGIVDHVVASVEIPLEHVTLVVTDFTEEYGDWSMLKARIHWIGRTEEDWTVATAQVTLRITDPSLTIIGKNALEWLSNLYKLDCPHVQVLRTESVANCRNLISISLPRVSSMDVGVFAEVRMSAKSATQIRPLPSNQELLSVRRANYSISPECSLHWRVRI